MHNFKELKVWQKSVEYSVDINKLTSQFPKEEKYGLMSQMRRATVSVSSNIAEGTGRRTGENFNNFLGTASGSSYELETELLISQKLNFVSEEEYTSMVRNLEEIQKNDCRTSKIFKYSILKLNNVS